MKMSNQHPAHTYIAVIGAYERDNFGDLLFLEVTTSLLRPFPVVPLSLISRDMTKEGGKTVISSSAWFDVCRDEMSPTAAIVIGGEVLTCSSYDALACDIEGQRNDFFQTLNNATKNRLKEAICWKAAELAYVPEQSLLAACANTSLPFALNSVGGSSLKEDTLLHRTAIHALNTADYISVRDSATYDAIRSTEEKNQHIELHPDIVNVLPITHPRAAEDAFENELTPRFPTTKPYLLIQLNDNYILEHSSESIAEAIAEAANNFCLSVLFQPAGTAPGHDSLEMLDEIARRTRDLRRQDIAIHTQRDRNIWTQVAAIAHSACFVGTSLHGRIVASAYGRPRVSLKNHKVNAYASTWESDLDQPFEIPLNRLCDSIGRAMKADRIRLQTHATRQANDALLGFSNLRERLGITSFNGDALLTDQKIRLLTEKSLVHECEILRNALIDIAHDLSLAQDAKRQANRQLEQLLESKGWKFLSPIRKLHNLLHGHPATPLTSHSVKTDK